ncbi:VWA domain-containing protein [Candidatus Woesearchaeota archaeon]|nr:VWA domain-containing protein [Candidatus Woesearchaeota archaeon]
MIPSYADTRLQEEKLESAFEISGKLKLDKIGEKLMHSVLENDKETIDKGKIIKEALNQGIGAFNPDIMFEQLVKSYKIAENLYGQKILRAISGYDASYIDRNIKIPEFQRELKDKLREGVQKLKNDKIIDKEGNINEAGIELATIALYIEELDNISPKGDFGERVHKRSSVYGEKGEAKLFRKGNRYKDISVRQTLKTAIRRSHQNIITEDIRVHERESRGKTYLVYAVDASGSMRGSKIDAAKKAGVALAYKAIDNKDNVGLIVFNTDIKSKIYPTNDFGLLLKEIAKIRAAQETNIVDMIKQSIGMFPNEHITKHLILLSDALPTIGKNPEEETLKEAANAKAAGITISIIGIDLDGHGKNLAKKIVEISQGRLYIAKNIENIDKIILEDYYSVV